MLVIEMNIFLRVVVDLLSTMIAEMIIELMINNPDTHALVVRKVANTLRDSVFAQFKWAISKLNLEELFKSTVSPMQIVYLPTGQTIYFRGGDEPEKIKSIKPGGRIYSLYVGGG